MTREEAIELIESARKTMYLPKSKEYISDFGYALEMAIKALEQEPCDDAISREKALKEVHNIVIDGECYRVVQEETLLGLPSVTPTLKAEPCAVRVGIIP